MVLNIEQPLEKVVADAHALFGNMGSLHLALKKRGLGTDGTVTSVANFKVSIYYKYLDIHLSPCSYATPSLWNALFTLGDRALFLAQRRLVLLRQRYIYKTDSDG
jgi:hypothetical protein